MGIKINPTATALSEQTDECHVSRKHEEQRATEKGRMLNEKESFVRLFTAVGRELKLGISAWYDRPPKFEELLL